MRTHRLLGLCSDNKRQCTKKIPTPSNCANRSRMAGLDVLLLIFCVSTVLPLVKSEIAAISSRVNVRRRARECIFTTGDSGKHMPAQDDARENQLIDLFNLYREENRSRHGTDAILKIDRNTLIKFELKSVTVEKGSLSTVRDLGRDHIDKWRDTHWIVAFYDKSGKLSRCKYASPDDMQPWIEKIWNYVEADFRMADLVPDTVTLREMQGIVGMKEKYTRDDAKRLHKNQYSAAQYKELMDLDDGYSPEQMLGIFRDRVRYLLLRGSTLNNPHIPASYFNHHPDITREYAATLRKLVKAWIKDRRTAG